MLWDILVLVGRWREWLYNEIRISCRSWMKARWRDIEICQEKRDRGRAENRESTGFSGETCQMKGMDETETAERKSMMEHGWKAMEIIRAEAWHEAL